MKMFQVLAVSMFVILGFASSAFAAETKLSDVQVVGVPDSGKCATVAGRVLCAAKDGSLNLVTITSGGSGTMQSVSMPPDGKCSREGESRFVICAPGGGGLVVIPNLQ